MAIVLSSHFTDEEARRDSVLHPRPRGWWAVGKSPGLNAHLTAPLERCSHCLMPSLSLWESLASCADAPVACTHSIILTNLALAVPHRRPEPGACQNLSMRPVSCLQGGEWGQIGKFSCMQKACYSGFGERLTLGFSIFQSIAELLYQHTALRWQVENSRFH